MPCFARDFGYFVVDLILHQKSRLRQNLAYFCKVLLPLSSRNGSKTEILTTKKKEEEQVFLHISRYLRTHAKLLLDCFLILKHAVLVHSNDYHILALQT